MENKDDGPIKVSNKMLSFLILVVVVILAFVDGTSKNSGVEESGKGKTISTQSQSR